MLQPPQNRSPRYEEIPRPPTQSFTLREVRYVRAPFNWHYHPELEFTFITKGCGLRYVGDSINHFEMGDICLVGSNLPHWWAAEARKPAVQQALVIQFRPELWGEPFLKMPENRALVRLFERAKKGVLLQVTTRRDVGRLICEMRKTSIGSWQRLSHLLMILGRVADSRECLDLASSNYVKLVSDSPKQNLDRVLQYIHANLEAHITEPVVAKVAGMSPQSFSRFFKRAMGKTFVAYMNQLRVGNACQMLLETDQNITEVAFAAGFNNLSHFNAQFRQFKKMSPREYRVLARQGKSQVAATHFGMFV